MHRIEECQFGFTHVSCRCLIGHVTKVQCDKPELHGVMTEQEEKEY